MSTIRIRYYAWSGYEITTQDGRIIIIDPYITGDPHAPFPVSDVTKADLILVSHASGDHGLMDALDIAKRTRAKVAFGQDSRVHAAAAGFPREQIAKSLVPGGDFTLRADGSVFGGQSNLRPQRNDISVRATYACHTSFTEYKGSYISGHPLGFIVRPYPDVCIYHTGDTSLTSDMKLIGQLERPDVIMVNCSNPNPGGNRDMTPYEAALAVEWVGAKLALPAHHAPGSKDAKEFVRLVRARLPGVKAVELKPGASLTFKT